MHKPTPYGTYPLVLRHYNTPNPRSGELLFNYEDLNLYVCNRANNNNAQLIVFQIEESIASILSEEVRRSL